MVNEEIFGYRYLTQRRSEEEKKALVSRMNRLVGQMKGIGRMIEEDRYCDDVLIQLSAVDKSIKSLSLVLLESHMKTCMAERVRAGEEGAIDEIVELFRRFQ